MQSLTTCGAIGHALSVAPALFVIVEERPLVLVLVWLPPKFSPNPFFALALAIKNSHEPPCLSHESSQKYRPDRLCLFCDTTACTKICSLPRLWGGLLRLSEGLWRNCPFSTCAYRPSGSYSKGFGYRVFELTLSTAIFGLPYPNLGNNMIRLSLSSDDREPSLSGLVGYVMVRRST
jgi:hypothetical protein